MVLNCCCRGDSATANESYAIDWDHLVVFDFSLCSHFSPLYFCLSSPVQVSLSLPFSVVQYLPSASSFNVTQAGAGQLCVSECVSTLLIPSEYRAVISVFNSDWLCAVMPHYLIIQTTADWMLKDQSLEIHDNLSWSHTTDWRGDVISPELSDRPTVTDR